MKLKFKFGYFPDVPLDNARRSSLLLAFLETNHVEVDVCFSKPVDGGDIKTPFLEISILRIVSSVLPPTKVNQVYATMTGYWRRLRELTL